MMNELIQKLDTLIALHRRNGDIWVDFFEGCKERIARDPMFGCEYLTMAWHGIGAYDDERILSDDKDEAQRLELHPRVYQLATEVTNVRN